MTEHNSITVGIPRALLYHRYGAMWETYFQTLGVKTLLSPVTSRETVEVGSALAIDETCLSAKIYLGHVQTLVGQCDQIFIPRYSNTGRHEIFCARFEAMYDQARSLFRDSGQRFISCNVDVMEDSYEAKAYEELGKALGFTSKAAKQAYTVALREQQKAWKAAVAAQELLYRKDGLKILVAGHGYIVADSYIGKPVMDGLRNLGAVPLRADITDRDAALRDSAKYSPTLRWVVNRELMGGILRHMEQVDGIILLSAFPCGPDAMVNELLTRRLNSVPILNLVLDEQTGTAGIETRLESFVDIIRFKEGAL